jgi:hypothetical protein
VPNARLATVLGVLAAVLVLAGVWSRGPATTIDGRVTRIVRGNGVSGGRVYVGDASVHQDQVGQLHVGDQVELTDQGGSTDSTFLLVIGAACAVAALANGLRARWVGEAINGGWTTADVRPIEVAVRGRTRTLAWVDGTLADTLGIRRVRADLGPTARVAGDPTTGRFVLDDGRHLLAMKPVRRE